ncbi:MAG: hypothetical protein MZV63_63480 [Marinilabiliales bacterium]|nr:hypothetical protein [Marinilabiliales bacterium]
MATTENKVIIKAVEVGIYYGEPYSQYGKEPGTSTSRWPSVDPNKIKTEISQLLDGIEGIEIKMVGERIVIDGEILTENDSKRIDKVMALYEPGREAC